MKKSHAIQLILITAALASCNRPGYLAIHNSYPPDDIYGDTTDTAPYLWGYSFRSGSHFFLYRHHNYWHGNNHRPRNNSYAYRPRPKGLARHMAVTHGGFGHSAHHGSFAHS
ncbi:hypothetical protein ACTHGU_02945 [Chitinophagaceae bacterium MMS25-I14]